jgi:hypothetical protein
MSSNKDDEKRKRFKRVAEKRTQKILNMLRLLGNCGNKNNYKYSEEDVKKIFSAIEKEVSKTKEKFKFTEEEEEIDFKL